MDAVDREVEKRLKIADFTLGYERARELTIEAANVEVRKRANIKAMMKMLGVKVGEWYEIAGHSSPSRIYARRLDFEWFLPPKDHPDPTMLNVVPGVRITGSPPTASGEPSQRETNMVRTKLFPEFMFAVRKACA